MVNPFDFEKDAARFVEATQDASKRETKITQLTIARNSFFAALLIQSLVLLAVLILDYRKLFAEGSLMFFLYVLNMAALYHSDVQIEFLKASRKEAA